MVTAVHMNKQEVATVQSNGEYRVMGLIPGNEYKLTFSQNDQIIRTIPAEIKVTIENEEEVDGVIFYGVYERKRVTIEGSIFFEGEGIESVDSLSATKYLFEPNDDHKVTLELIDLLNDQTIQTY
jgi:hypothetical protein